VEGDRISAVIGAEAQVPGVSAKEVWDGYILETALRTFVTAHDVANQDECIPCILEGRIIQGISKELGEAGSKDLRSGPPDLYEM
jgi:hypothetical protein